MRKQGSRRNPFLAVTVVFASALVLVALLGSAASAAIGSITEFSVPTPNSQPNQITTGNDGNLWFTEFAGGSNKIARVTPSGAITEYNVPTNNAGPLGITAGSGNSIFFTEWSANKIGRFNTSTHVFTEYPIPTANSQPTSIVLGPDGNLWFTESGSSKIGKLNPGSGTIADFATPTAGAQPNGITVGPDSRLWFTESSGNQIGAITTGAVFTEYGGLTAASVPTAITSGSDGRLWFTENNADQIGAITTAGAVSEYALTASTSPTGIAAGADNRLWFAEPGTNKMASIDVTGATINEYSIPTAASTPTGVTQGPDLNIWFTETAGNKIGRLEDSANLTISKTGTGAGTVTSAPAGINCGATCVHKFGEDMPITLTAVADAGSRFTGWSGGGCAGIAPCVLSLTGNTTVTANFVKQWDLNVTVTNLGAGSGSVTSSPGTISCPGTCVDTFDQPTGVTLTAAPAVGSRFVGWFGDCSGTGGCSVTMNAAKNVEAKFIDISLLSVTKSGTGTGTVTSSPSGINCGGTCAANFDNGSTATLTATPNGGNRFDTWTTGPCSGSTNPICNVPISAPITVDAAFVDTQNLSVTVTTPSGGQTPGSGTVQSTPSSINCSYTGPNIFGSNTCSHNFDAPTVVTLTATPASGSRFVGWAGSGCSGTGTCMVTMSADRSVTATFVKVWDLTVNTTGSGDGTVTSSPGSISCPGTCVETFDDPTGVSLTATPAAGSRFAGWSGDCIGTGGCNVTMNTAHTVTATFTKQWTLNVTTSGAGTGSVTSSPSGINCGGTCSALFDQGTNVTLTPSAGPNSRFAGWSGDCTGTGACNVAMGADANVDALFVESWTLTVTKSGSGSGSVSSLPSGINCGGTCAANFDDGQMVTLTATPSGSSSFVGWGGSGCSGTGTCEVTMTGAKTVNAKFSLPYQPDGLIRVTGGVSFIGDNIYNLTGQQQTVTTSRMVGRSKSYDVRVENAGDQVDSISIQGCNNGGGATFTYRDGTGNITGAVKNGTYSTPLLDAENGPSTGKPLNWTIEMTITGNTNGMHKCLVVMTSDNDGSKQDAVKGKLKSTN